MNPLQYTSEEMFSSTELIRKSKMVFDKLQKNDIEKAIILRDGKPSFMLLDFAKYEKLMHEYLALKDQVKNKSSQKISSKPKNEDIDINSIDDESIDYEKTENINDNELENALAQIDELDLDDLVSEKVDKQEEEKVKDETSEKEPLKDFWE